MESPRALLEREKTQISHEKILPAIDIHYLQFKNQVQQEKEGKKQTREVWMCESKTHVRQAYRYSLRLISRASSVSICYYAGAV